MPTMTIERKLQLLRSDLKDSRSPDVLRKHPHLADPELVAQIERQIAELEQQLAARE